MDVLEDFLRVKCMLFNFIESHLTAFRLTLGTIINNNAVINQRVLMQARKFTVRDFHCS